MSIDASIPEKYSATLTTQDSEWVTSPMLSTGAQYVYVGDTVCTDIEVGGRYYKPDHAASLMDFIEKLHKQENPEFYI